MNMMYEALKDFHRKSRERERKAFKIEISLFSQRIINIKPNRQNETFKVKF